jgi:Methyltransferase domain
VLTWIAEDTFTVEGTTFVCRPVGRRFHSEPGRFCLLKPRHEVEWYDAFLRERGPERIVEVGAYDGGSSAFIAELAHPERLVAIDQRPEPGPALTEFVARRGFAAVLTPYYGVDQRDAARLRAIVAEAFGAARLDLVIDDASHLVDATRATFNCLFPHVAAGGSYLIEDWSWAHSGMGNAGTWADQQPLTAFIFELILACASQPKIISKVTVWKNYALVERGPAEIDTLTFAVTECYDARAADLLPNEQ